MSRSRASSSDSGSPDGRGGDVFLTRRAQFCASHRYYRDEWSEARNREVFGACANPWGHGHNYVLEVTIAGAVDPETGMVLNLRDIDGVLREEIISALDHRHLNAEVAEFAATVPTTENLAVWIWERLERAFAALPGRLHRVRLYESPELYVEFFGESAEDDDGTFAPRGREGPP